MTETIIFSWDFLIYPLAAFGYIELVRWLSKRWYKNRRLSVEEILANYARNQGISEYDVFHRASSNWDVSPHQVDKDFNAYLQTMILPHYVRDFIRKLPSDSRGQVCS
jgi:hypothetical protein